jgi:hypothetical protein
MSVIICQILQKEYNITRFSFSLPYFGAGIAQSVCRLDTCRTAERSDFESRKGQDFSPFPVVQTGSGAHSASYTVGIGGSFPGIKQPGSEADHSPPTSTDVKNPWIYTTTSTYVFMA